MFRATYRLSNILYVCMCARARVCASVNDRAMYAKRAIAVTIRSFCCSSEVNCDPSIDRWIDRSATRPIIFHVPVAKSETNREQAGALPRCRLSPSRLGITFPPPATHSRKPSKTCNRAGSPFGGREEPKGGGFSYSRLDPVIHRTLADSGDVASR